MTTERSPPSETGNELLPGPPAGPRTFTATTCAAGESDGGFESHPTAAAPGGPCQQVRRLRDGPHPAVDLMPTPRGPATVVLAGRATTVPFTTDASGCKRTPTDNPTAAMACAVRRLARWRSCPIWLCKQEVGWSRLASGPCRARPADRSLVAEDRSAQGVRNQTGPDQPGATLGPHAIRRPRTTPVSSGQSPALFNGAIRPLRRFSQRPSSP